MMMSVYDMMGTNADLETQGIDYNMGKGGIFVLARSGGANVRYGKVVEHKFRPHRRQIQNGTIDNDLARNLLLEAFCEAVLLGWREVTGPDGKALKWSVDAAKKLMTDLPELYSELSEVAGDYTNYQGAIVEDDAKN
jgi:hypothetical protein